MNSDTKAAILSGSVSILSVVLVFISCLKYLNTGSVYYFIGAMEAILLGFMTADRNIWHRRFQNARSELEKKGAYH